ncbi:MAG TPA: DUF4097 family beta strand repeat-containing protein [Thermoanaerobaculia bacterium]|nr:DUF4097 family beta strand repeat-containing protein [Thermoanaerobaculia bacterium]
MNRRNRNLYLLASLLILAACDYERFHDGKGSRRTYSVSRTWPAAGIRHVKVTEVSGNVRVDPSLTDQITLEATVRGRRLEAKQGVENSGFFLTEIDGDTLRIGRREHRRKLRFNIFFGHQDRTINYVLRVPPAVSLELRTVNGRIATRGIAGETEATTVNGTIDVEVTGAEELAATTVNGRVRAKFTKEFNGAQFKSVNGGVEAFLPNDASFSVDLAQVNGDFEATFPLSIHSQPGSRRVSGEVNGGQHRLKIVTVNGDVEVMRLSDAL